MTVDTNILIAYFNGEARARESLEQWRQEGRVLFISSLSITEVLSFSSLSAEELDDVRDFLRTFISIPVTDDIAETAAGLRRVYRLHTPDAIIAATALSRSVPLVSRDRQFRKVCGISVIEI